MTTRCSLLPLLLLLLAVAPQTAQAGYYCATGSYVNVITFYSSSAATSIYMKSSSGSNLGSSFSCQARVVAYGSNTLTLRLTYKSLLGYGATVKVYDGYSSYSSLLWTITDSTSIDTVKVSSGGYVYITITTYSSPAIATYGATLYVTQGASVIDGNKLVLALLAVFACATRL